MDPKIMAICGGENSNNSGKPQTMGETVFSVDDLSKFNQF